MPPNNNTRTSHSSGKDKSTVPFGSNEVRLSPRQCIIAAVVLAVLFHFIPILWRRVEPLELGPDYRIPFRLGYDYWTYDRYSGEVCREDKTLVIGAGKQFNIR